MKEKINKYISGKVDLMIRYIFNDSPWRNINNLIDDGDGNQNEFEKELRELLDTQCRLVFMEKQIEIDKLKEEKGKMHECLAFYGDEKNWMGDEFVGVHDNDKFTNKQLQIARRGDSGGVWARITLAESFN